MGYYQEKMANKNKIDYIKSQRIYLGDTETYIESTGAGTFRLVGSNASLKVNSDGSMTFSGDVRFSGNSNFKSISSNTIRSMGSEGVIVDADNARYDDGSKGTIWEDIPISSSVGFMKVNIAGSVGYVPVFDIASLS